MDYNTGIKLDSIAYLLEKNNELLKKIGVALNTEDGDDDEGNNDENDDDDDYETDEQEDEPHIENIDDEDSIDKLDIDDDDLELDADFDEPTDKEPTGEENYDRGFKAKDLKLTRADVVAKKDELERVEDRRIKKEKERIQLNANLTRNTVPSLDELERMAENED